MEIVSIGFHLDHCSGSYEHLLVVFDPQYTSIPYKKQSITYATERMISDLILRFGIPKHILHDQSKEFDNKLFNQLTKLRGARKLRTMHEFNGLQYVQNLNK